MVVGGVAKKRELKPGLKVSDRFYPCRLWL